VPRISSTILLLSLCTSGCAYKIGSGLVRGMLEEAGGQGQSDGVEEVGDQVLERALLVELGHQLGAGLSSGATDITPEQREALERTIDGLLATATRRTGKGLRNEVSPELRNMVNSAIIQSLSDGLRGELGDSMEETVDRVISSAVDALRVSLNDEGTKFAVSDLIRDSVYYAMREGHGGTPSVGETLKFTIEEDVLTPLETTVGGITEGVAYQVGASAQRTEQLLRAIIGGLILVIGMFLVAYVVRGRQLRREAETRLKAEAGLRSLDVALEVLDEDTRAEILHKLHEHEKYAEAELKAQDEAEALGLPRPPSAVKRDDPPD
jgi:hypothetical protein